MSNLEGQVKPLLQPLLSGAAASLDTVAQSIIGVWAVKTAMALEGSINPMRVLTYNPSASNCG
jgi:hypothetical protein